MEKEHGLKDVIVVGAGPAGAMTAKVISEKGHSVMIIDKKKETGFPVQCAEAISLSGLESNGIMIQKHWLKSCLKGLKIHSPDGKYFFFLDEVCCIDRHRFDQWLSREAVKNGCELLLNTRTDSVKYEEGVWHVSGSGRVFKSRILIGADGPESSVAQWLGILRKRDVINGINYKFYLEDVSFPQDMLHMFYESGLKGGYIWVFPRGDEYNIGIGGTEEFSRIQKTLENFCKSKGIDINKKKSMTTGIIPVYYDMERFTKGFAIVIGDAAGLTNPLFGSGIRSALFSGRLAGKIVCKALESNDLSVLSEYEDIMRKNPICDPVLHKARELLYSFSDDEWNFVTHVFAEKDWREVSLIKILQKFVLNPKFLNRIKKFWAIKKGIEISTKHGW